MCLEQATIRLWPGYKGQNSKAWGKEFPLYGSRLFKMACFERRPGRIPSLCFLSVPLMELPSLTYQIEGQEALWHLVGP